MARDAAVARFDAGEPSPIDPGAPASASGIVTVRMPCSE
jgi:hypothetical protein